MAASQLDAVLLAKSVSFLNPTPHCCAPNLSTASCSALASQSTFPLSQVRIPHSTFLGTGVLQVSAAARERRALLRSRQVMAAALPANYGYVALTIVASGFLVQWQAVQVSIQRKKYKVRYPKMYEDAENSVFNCYQRAHQNTLEGYSLFLALLVVGGLGYPVISSLLGAIWIAGRVVYSLGYYSGDPKNRMKGSFNYIGLIGLAVATIVFGFRNISIPGLQ